MVAGVGALEHEAVDAAARRTAPAPGRPAATVLGERRRDQVVERPVEVRQRHVDDDPRHGQHRASPVGGADAAAVAARSGSSCSGAVRQRSTAPAVSRPTDRSASTRSVRSQVKLAAVAAEVPVGRGLGVDRPQQVEVADDRGRAQVEDRA